MNENNSTFDASWNYPTAIRFGVGSINAIGVVCEQHNLERLFIVTDRQTADLPFINNIQELLRRAGLFFVVFSGVEPNPTVENVVDGVAAFRGNDCDGVIAIGGGSAIDAGKTIAMMVGQTRRLLDLEDTGDNWKRIKADSVAACIAIPTTAGTGAEVGRAAVIIDTESRRKMIVFHPCMMPTCVVGDPELSIGLPQSLTAATGIDAFTHCFEAFCVPSYHPMADGIALEGMKLIATWLPIAFEDGGDIEARSHMLAAASMGAVAFQKGLGAVHAISHAVGAHYNTHHGLTNAVFLPYVILRNRIALEEKMKAVGTAIGIKTPDFDGVLDWVLELRESLLIPHDSAALGLQATEIPELAVKAEGDATLAGNPIPLNANDLERILSKSLAGELI